MTDRPFMQIPAHLNRVPEFITEQGFTRLVRDYSSRAASDPGYEARSAFRPLQGDQDEAIALPADNGLVEHGLPLSELRRRVERMNHRVFVGFLARSDEAHLVVGTRQQDGFEVRYHRAAKQGERQRVERDSLRLEIARRVGETDGCLVHEVGVDDGGSQITVEYIGAQPDARIEEAIRELCIGWSVVFQPLSGILQSPHHGSRPAPAAVFSAPSAPSQPSSPGAVPAAVFSAASVPGQAAGTGMPEEATDDESVSVVPVPPEPVPADEEPIGKRPRADTYGGRALALLERTGKEMHWELIAYELGITSMESFRGALGDLVKTGWLVRTKRGWFKARYPHSADPAPAEEAPKGEKPTGDTLLARILDLLERTGREMSRKEIGEELGHENLNSLSALLGKLVTRRWIVRRSEGRFKARYPRSAQ